MQIVNERYDGGVLVEADIPDFVQRTISFYQHGALVSVRAMTDDEWQRLRPKGWLADAARLRADLSVQLRGREPGNDPPRVE